MKTTIETMLDAVKWEPIPASLIRENNGLPVATHRGVLNVGGVKFRCFQLDNGVRVFHAHDFEVALGITTAAETRTR